MNSRRKAREAALQALYQCDTLDEWSEDTITLYFSIYNPDALTAEEGAPLENARFAQSLIRGVVEQMAEIDRHISGASTHWSVSRMPRVDRNILRCATYELLFVSDIPVSVSINEAIEIAKRYGTADSSMFINGVLDKIATNLMSNPESITKVGSTGREKRLAVNE